jgi:hypothetical protein
MIRKEINNRMADAKFSRNETPGRRTTDIHAVNESFGFLYRGITLVFIFSI